MAACIFDLDGTLLDSLQDIGDSMNRVLARHDYPTHALDAYRLFIGDGLNKLVERALPSEAAPYVEDFVEYMNAEYAASWSNNTRPYAGIKGLLDSLSRAGVPMSILSNKPDGFTREMCDKLLGEWRFVAVSGVVTLERRKPDPRRALEMAGEMGVAAAECYFIGDSGVDIMTAKNAGMVAVGVDWGFRPSDELRDADHIIMQPAELLAILNLG